MFDMELSRSPCCLRPMLLFTGAKQIYFVFVILPAAVSRRLRIRQRLAQAEDSWRLDIFLRWKNERVLLCSSMCWCWYLSLRLSLTPCNALVVVWLRSQFSPSFQDGRPSTYPVPWTCCRVWCFSSKARRDAIDLHWASLIDHPKLHFRAFKVNLKGKGKGRLKLEIPADAIPPAWTLESEKLRGMY